jgi:Holliday junction DNA helicase RuvA
MISRISGKIVDVGANNVVIDCQGVGYKLFITPTLAIQQKTGTEATFWTHLAVREDKMDLYGFTTKEELDFFELLITISGIGPKSALGILSLATLDTLFEAITTGEAALLTKVAGIGRKNAQKIVVELKDKIGDKSFDTTRSSSPEIDVIEALKTLGYQERVAREALQQVEKTITDTGERIKSALKILNS